MRSVTSCAGGCTRTPTAAPSVSAAQLLLLAQRTASDGLARSHLLLLHLPPPPPHRAAPSFAPRSSILPGGGFKVPPGTNLRLPLYPIGKDQKQA